MFADELADNEKGNENHCERKTALDENAGEPIVILPFLQKRDERAESDGHENRTQPNQPLTLPSPTFNSS